MKELLLDRFLQVAAENGTPDIPLDPSDFETSGRLATIIIATVMIAIAADKWRNTEKLKGENDVRWTGDAVAVGFAALGLLIAAETATDIPWDKIPILFELIDTFQSKNL